MTANAGYHAYATGDVLTAAQVQYNLQNQTVMYFATTGARDTALSGVLVEGMVSYVPSTGLMYYSGSAWTAVGGGASGGLTLLSTTTLSGSSTSITVASNTYTELWAYCNGLTPSAEVDVYIRLNGNSSSNNYMQNMTGTQSTSGFTNHSNLNGMLLDSGVSGGWGTNSRNSLVLRLPNPNSTQRKIMVVNAIWDQGSSAFSVTDNTVSANVTSAITSIEFAISSGSMSAGTVLVYGVK